MTSHSILTKYPKGRKIPHPPSAERNNWVKSGQTEANGNE